jgi:Zn finger protein HypA/HybF involved in hydrogenase expression
VYFKPPKDVRRTTRPVEKWCRKCDKIVTVMRAVRKCPECGGVLEPKYKKSLSH